MKRINFPAVKQTAKAYQAKPKVNNSTNNYPNLNLVQLKQLKQHSPVQFQQSILSLQSTIGSQAVVQLLKQLDVPSAPEVVHHQAAKGVQGSGGRLPHYDKIQNAFGKHDISQVQAYTSNESAAASRAIGAKAYATGNKIAFAESNPDLHTAAHEAAHVIQQRAGVHLKGGVGAVGDKYEQQADKVADGVVQGKAVESLLDDNINSGKSASNRQSLQSQTVVQRAIGFEFETGWQVEVGELENVGAPNEIEKRRPLKIKEGIATFDGFKIEADESNHGAAEIEFIVHPPIEEGPAGLRRLAEIMEAITAFGKGLERRAREAKEVGKNEFVIENYYNYYIKPETDLTLTAGPQITTGLDLAVIPQLADLEEKHNLITSSKLKGSLGELSVTNQISTISPQLKGLLAVIINYLKRGADANSNEKKNKPRNSEERELMEINTHLSALGYPKQIGNTLLARTQFSKLFTLIPPEEQSFYKKNPKDWVKLVMQIAGNLNPKESIIEKGVREDDAGFKTLAVYKPDLTREGWLIGILKGADLLRNIKDPDSLGALGDKTETVGPHAKTEAGIFEFRASQEDKIPLDAWSTFAINFFKFIMLAHGHKDEVTSEVEAMPKGNSNKSRNWTSIED